MTFNLLDEMHLVQTRLLDLTDKLRVLSEGHCKGAEPSLSIQLDNELRWSAEIYSYLMDFEDGGRHHFFEADTPEELFRKIHEAIDKEAENMPHGLRIDPAGGLKL